MTNEMEQRLLQVERDITKLKVKDSDTSWLKLGGDENTEQKERLIKIQTIQRYCRTS